MKTKHRAILITSFLLALTALAIIYICRHNITILNPKGSIGMKQRNLIYISSALMLLVVIPVYVMTVIFSIKYREGKKDSKYNPDWEHSYVAEAAWWGVPFVIILILAIITYKSSHELNPFKPLQSDKKPIEIQAIALQWRWLFIYPEQGVASMNYLQFPANTPLNFEITADAPMNSFWIPQLGGQIYAMPAMRSKIHLIADQEGEFWGRSANLSGTGFSGMRFNAVASSEEDFDKWVSKAKSSGNALTFSDYEQLAEPSEDREPMTYRLAHQNLFDQVLMKYEPEGAH